jgi:hypothetical protein
MILNTNNKINPIWSVDTPYAKNANCAKNHMEVIKIKDGVVTEINITKIDNIINT